MIKALLLIFDPTATWEGIFLARRKMAFVLVAYLCPLLLVASAAEGFGLVLIEATPTTSVKYLISARGRARIHPGSGGG